MISSLLLGVFRSELDVFLKEILIWPLIVVRHRSNQVKLYSLCYVGS